MLIPSSTAVVTPASSEPVTLAEAKAHCRAAEYDEDDSLITALIVAARDHVERISGLRLLPTVLRSNYSDWPASGDAIWLAGCPVLSASNVAVQYTDVNGTTQTLSTATYTVDVDHRPPRILLNPTYSWPVLYSGGTNNVRVNYTAGFADAASVPEQAKLAMRLIVAHFYKNREATTTGQAPKDLPLGICDILAPIQVRYGY